MVLTVVLHYMPKPPEKKLPRASIRAPYAGYSASDKQRKLLRPVKQPFYVVLHSVRKELNNLYSRKGFVRVYRGSDLVSYTALYEVNRIDTA